MLFILYGLMVVIKTNCKNIKQMNVKMENRIFKSFNVVGVIYNLQRGLIVCLFCLWYRKDVLMINYFVNYLFAVVNCLYESQQVADDWSDLSFAKSCLNVVNDDMNLLRYDMQLLIRLQTIYLNIVNTRKVENSQVNFQSKISTENYFRGCLQFAKKFNCLFTLLMIS